MKNIKVILERFTYVLSKLRLIPLFLCIQNIVLAIVVLIYINSIVSYGNINGAIDYNQVVFFYQLISIILYFLAFIYIPLFLSNTINNLINNNIFECLLATNVKLDEIVIASFIRGVFNVLILICSSIPIACVSLYFGGVGVITLIKYILSLLLFIFFFSSISILISSIVSEDKVAILISYIVGFFILIINIILVNVIITNDIILVLYYMICIAISLFLLNRTINVILKN